MREPEVGLVGVNVIEDYRRGYVPPFNVAAGIAELLDYVPSVHLRLLGRVVLTNASGLDAEFSSELTDSRRVRIGRALGRYHPAISGFGGIPTKPAWIEIFVDNVAKHGWISFASCSSPF